MRLNFAPWHSLKTRVTLFTLAIFIVSIWSLSLYTSRMLREDMVRLLGEAQFSAATLLADQVNTELDDRFQALKMLAAVMAPAVPGDAPALQASFEKYVIFHRLFSGGTFIAGTDGVAIASALTAPEHLGVNYRSADYVAMALKDGSMIVGAPVAGKTASSPGVGMAVPIRAGDGRIIGVVAGVIDLGKPNFLSRITSGSYGRSGALLIAAPRHALFVAASDPERAMQRLPAPGINPMHDKYASGYEGYGVLVNLHGVEELTAAKGIPAAGWFLVVTMPSAEAFAPIRALQQRMLLATLLLTLVAAGLTWWMLRHQLSPLLAAAGALGARSASDQALAPLPIARDDEIGKLIGGFNSLLATLRQREIALTDSEARFRDFFRKNSSVMLIIDPASGAITDANAAAASYYGVSQEQLSAMSIDQINTLAPEQIARERQLAAHEKRNYFHFTHRLASGELRDVEVYSTPIGNGAAPALFSIVHDITERKHAAERIHTLAFFDQLTGLPNRTMLMDRLKHAMAGSARTNNHGALLFIDLDNFKALNDTLGHDAGDQLLMQVAGRLVLCVRASDTVARVGGDEFVVILVGLDADRMQAASETEAVAKKMLVVLSQVYRFDHAAHHSTASIGATLFSGADIAIDILMKQTDLTMYKAKAAGRNTVRFFDPAMEIAVRERATMESDLRRALQERQFVLHYQPQVDQDCHVIGAEALVRWQHPRHGLVAPNAFIGLAEECGLILPLGDWVMHTACTQLACWAQAVATAHLTIAVNVSANQFRQPDFVELVLAVLRDTRANPQRLKLELTESLLVENVSDVIEKMSALKRHGVGFSLDDFGTGYSSLSYLKRLPLDELKIDRSFVRDILVDPNDAAIAKTVVALAHSLGLGVIAEGVESDGQKAFLMAHGCRMFQGYLFGRPVPIEAFVTMLEVV
ncbi:diguanylate cyclase (GGDEF)-like protein/PAS domain S-box-containing protein [Actimicrobium sp. GrIS 1.19]|uniref:bifunctional diguanylate cyclase/phosphodiesterase n=1 Tax=Actimicrobium sp. GrIS 1.19 TaxID=3071708 RepID=UPI002E06E2B5|nr:diguanylate cyclase (GGDEF)-like protein/PAS domain S-box-containing protein [Actimicrobium sp. GrIS 1.19]